LLAACQAALTKEKRSFIDYKQTTAGRCGRLAQILDRDDLQAFDGGGLGR
jgi:hypothetical protein